MPRSFHIQGWSMGDYGDRSLKVYFKSDRVKDPEPRRNSVKLPGVIHPKDDGCNIHPHCLECPLMRCIYDSDAA